MKNKKKIIIISAIAIVIISIIGLFLFLNSNKNSNSLTISEKKWLEDKNNTANLIDININNDIPVFGYNGTGIYFTFIQYLEKETGLKFNLIPYKNTNNPTGDYSFVVSTENKGLNFYQSNYVLVHKNNQNILNINNVKETVAVLNKDLEAFKYYNNATNLTIKTFEDMTTMLDEFSKDTVTYMVLPNITYMNTILSNKYNIVYQFDDLKENFSLLLNGSNKTLNSIITKYFNIWKSEKLVQEFDKAFMNVYYYNRSLSEEVKSNLLSKQYVYGYVDYTPYEQVMSKDFVGINAGVINGFADLTGIEFNFKRFKNIGSLVDAVKKNEVDIAYNYFELDTSNVTRTNVNMNSTYVVLAKEEGIVNSLKSITKDIYMYRHTYLKDYVSQTIGNKITVYDELKKLSNIKDGVIIVDSNLYNYYRHSIFNNYFVIYSEKVGINNKFIVNNSNSAFTDLFNYYTASFNVNKLQATGYNNLLTTPSKFEFLKVITDNILAIILILITTLFASVFFLKKKKAKTQIKKEDKLKFVDMLTSLKNRNYLNHNIAIWGENTIYPQTIIIVDLNNVKYINDNFGHEEGDNVIKMAANILINTQLENSDIIRTDGNEFLVYLVGHEEKEVISYMRKLYKDLKELPHGFGAAMGYSIIDDDIKTIDDAINEATLDMRTNKER